MTVQPAETDAVARDVPSSERSARFDLALVGERDRLTREARRLAGDPDRAQDLVQDTYAKALRSAHRFRWGTSLRAWLLTILRNTASNRRRDQYRSRVEVDSRRVERVGGAAAAPEETPEDRLLRRTLDPQLRAALNGLPPALRQAVWMRDVEGQSYAEMAAVLEIPVGTVMSRIYRARRLLYDRLTGELDRLAGGSDGAL